MIEPRWLLTDEILHLHDLQLRTFGGSPGVRDRNLLEGATARPRQRFMYGELTSIVAIAAAYGTAFNANHPFIDGNKRVSFHALLVFLRLHELRLEAEEQEATEYILSVAAGSRRENELCDWVAEHAFPERIKNCI